jgi:ribonuclease HII
MDGHQQKQNPNQHLVQENFFSNSAAIKELTKRDKRHLNRLSGDKSPNFGHQPKTSPNALKKMQKTEEIQEKTTNQLSKREEKRDKERNKASPQPERPEWNPPRPTKEQREKQKEVPDITRDQYDKKLKQALLIPEGLEHPKEDRDCYIIGIDEAGTSAEVGSWFVAATAIPEAHYSAFRHDKLIKDSKKNKLDFKIMLARERVNRMTQVLGWKTVVKEVTPNQVQRGKLTETDVQAMIEVFRVILEQLSGWKVKKVVIDSVGSPVNLQNQVEEARPDQWKHVQVEVIPKADSKDLAVAASSNVAAAARILNIEDWDKFFQQRVPAYRNVITKEEQKQKVEVLILNPKEKSMIKVPIYLHDYHLKKGLTSQKEAMYWIRHHAALIPYMDFFFKHSNTTIQKFLNEYLSHVKTLPEAETVSARAFTKLLAKDSKYTYITAYQTPTRTKQEEIRDEIIDSKYMRPAERFFHPVVYIAEEEKLHNKRQEKHFKEKWRASVIPQLAERLQTLGIIPDKVTNQILDHQLQAKRGAPVVLKDLQANLMKQNLKIEDWGLPLSSRLNQAEKEIKQKESSKDIFHMKTSINNQIGLEPLNYERLNSKEDPFKRPKQEKKQPRDQSAVIKPTFFTLEQLNSINFNTHLPQPMKKKTNKIKEESDQELSTNRNLLKRVPPECSDPQQSPRVRIKTNEAKEQNQEQKKFPPEQSPLQIPKDPFSIVQEEIQDVEAQALLAMNNTANPPLQKSKGEQISQIPVQNPQQEKPPKPAAKKIKSKDKAEPKAPEQIPLLEILPLQSGKTSIAQKNQPKKAPDEGKPPPKKSFVPPLFNYQR